MDALEGGYDFADGDAFACSEVDYLESGAFREYVVHALDCLDVGAGEVPDVEVVAYACAVAGGPAGSGDLEYGPDAVGDLDEDADYLGDFALGLA